MFPNRALFLIELTIVLIWAPLNEAQETVYIVGGNNAEEREIPYQVSLQENGKHKCGGSIIASCWAITTAYCIAGSNIASLSILAGTTNLNAGGVRVAVEKTISHDNYKAPFQNNIALIKFKNCLTFNENIQPVTLGKSHIGPGIVGIVSGWGYTDQNYTIGTDNLKKLQVTTITNLECKKTFDNIGSGNICTSETEGRGICIGDYGGPLVEIATGTQIGLMSANVPCAHGSPDAYTRVSSFYKWIRENAK